MNLPVPIPVIDMAVSLRNISSFKEERLVAAELYKPVIKTNYHQKRSGYQTGARCLVFCYADVLCAGACMLHSASPNWICKYHCMIVVKIWRGGCIIRSASLETFYKAYKKNKQLPNILVDNAVAKLVKKKEKNLRAVLKASLQSKIPAGALMNSLSYFEAYTTAIMPVNLIQAQRDYFGAHYLPAY